MNAGMGPGAVTLLPMDGRPIGVFDSGLGGLTVVRALIDLLPDEHLVYFGDTGRYPYGPQPLDDVREYARQITSLLVERHDVKMIVVACNNASAAAELHPTTTSLTSWPMSSSVIWKAYLRTSPRGFGPYGKRPVSPK